MSPNYKVWDMKELVKDRVNGIFTRTYGSLLSWGIACCLDRFRLNSGLIFFSTCGSGDFLCKELDLLDTEVGKVQPTVAIGFYEQADLDGFAGNRNAFGKLAVHVVIVGYQDW